MNYKRTVSVRACDVPPPGGRRDMGAWWWVAIGLTAWLCLSLVAGLLLGPVLKGAAQAREAVDAQMGETPPKRDKPPQDGPHAA